MERDPAAQQVSSLAADFKDLIRLEDVKSRVEEQVVNQLARASLMSILLKQHTAEQANGRDTTSPARVERDPAVASSVSSASQRHPSSRGKKEAHRTPEPQRQQGERQQSSRPPLKKAASSSTLDARPSSSSSSSSFARAEPGADDGLTELERKEARFGSMFKKVWLVPVRRKAEAVAHVGGRHVCSLRCWCGGTRSRTWPCCRRCGRT